MEKQLPVTQVLTDDQERIKSGGQAPYPQPLPTTKEPKVFGGTRVVLALNEQRTLLSDVEPEYWHIAIPGRADYARVDVWPGQSMDETALYVYPGESVKVPSRGSALTLQNMSGVNGLIVQVYAISNVEFQYNPPRTV